MEPTSEQQLQQIKLDIEDAKKKVKYMEAYKRLKKNKDFKSLITDFYLEEYASRLVKLKASPAMQKDLEQTMIVQTMTGIGALDQFFININIEGQRAKMDMEEMAKVEEQILEEEASK